MVAEYDVTAGQMVLCRCALPLGVLRFGEIGTLSTAREKYNRGPAILDHVRTMVAESCHCKADGPCSIVESVRLNLACRLWLELVLLYWVQMA